MIIRAILFQAWLIASLLSIVSARTEVILIKLQCSLVIEFLFKHFDGAPPKYQGERRIMRQQGDKLRQLFRIDDGPAKNPFARL